MADTAEAFIDIQGVSKTYKSGHETVAALRDVYLAIRKGELLAIVGPSGAGKTTLIHIIGGLIKPDQGSVRVNGRALSKRSDKALSKYRNSSVGFIFQNASLLPHYTALENVMVPLIIAGVPRKRRQVLAQRYLEMVGLSKQATQKAQELSGGERQRVGIARALSQQPQIVIADEPTGSLDSARGLEIMHILETLSHQHGITVLMVTHDEKLAARADRIVHIHDGQVGQGET